MVPFVRVSLFQILPVDVADLIARVAVPVDFGQGFSIVVCLAM